MGVAWVPLVTQAYRLSSGSALRKIVHSLSYFVEGLMIGVSGRVSKPDGVVLLLFPSIDALNCFCCSPTTLVVAYGCDREMYWVFLGWKYSYHSRVALPIHSNQPTKWFLGIELLCDPILHKTHMVPL